MKKFIFDEYDMCINPNRIELGDKDFWLEIQTACNDDLWYSGFQYWQRGRTWEHSPSLNTKTFYSEHEAIRYEAEMLRKFLKRQNERTYNDIEVPDHIFTELKKMQTPQLSIF